MISGLDMEGKHEFGEFFYRVVYPGGVYLKTEPKQSASDTSFKMLPGEIFEVCEKFQGDDNVVFVRIAKEKDEWMREGWIFENLGEMIILEKIEVRQQMSGFFFFKVTASEGIRFQSTYQIGSPLASTVHPQGSVFAANEKVIPCGSDVAYIELAGNFGYIFQNEEGRIYPSLSKFGIEEELDSGENTPSSSPSKFDQTNIVKIEEDIKKKRPSCLTRPKSVKIFGVRSESANIPDGALSIDTGIIEIEPPREIDQKEEEGFFVLLVLHDSGSKILQTADLCSPTERNSVLRIGECCFASKKVTKTYAMIGSITFYKLTHQHSGWVIEERFGQKYVEEMPDQVERHAFFYEIIHPNGAQLWNNPRGSIIESEILPFQTEIEVTEKRVKAEDLLSSDEPTVFLKIKNSNFWTVESFNGRRCKPISGASLKALQYSSQQEDTKYEEFKQDNNEELKEESEVNEFENSKEMEPENDLNEKTLQEHPIMSVPRPTKHERVYVIPTTVSQWPGPTLKGSNCCSEPDAKEFAIRGRLYLTDKLKYPSVESAFKLLGSDVLYSNKKLHHISSRPKSFVQRFRCFYREKAQLKAKGLLPAELAQYNFDEPPFIIVLNVILPFGSMVSYYCPRHEGSSPFVGDARVDGLLRRFFDGTNEYRGQRLKLIPRCVEGPWVVKKAVGTRPAIVGGKIPQNYYHGEGYFEIELDIATTKATTYIFTVVKKFVQSVTIDMAFVLQGESEAELPERILFAVRYHQFDLSTVSTVDEWENLQASRLG